MNYIISRYHPMGAGLLMVHMKSSHMRVLSIVSVSCNENNRCELLANGYGNKTLPGILYALPLV